MVIYQRCDMVRMWPESAREAQRREKEEIEHKRREEARLQSEKAMKAEGERTQQMKRRSEEMRMDSEHAGEERMQERKRRKEIVEKYRLSKGWSKEEFDDWKRKEIKKREQQKQQKKEEDLQKNLQARWDVDEDEAAPLGLLTCIQWEEQRANARKYGEEERKRKEESQTM